MADDTKPLIHGLTVALDVVLIYVLLYHKLHTFDKAFVYAVIVAHALFYHAVHTDNKPLVDALHGAIFVTLTAGVFLRNKTLLLMCLTLLVTLQTMWGIFGDCILNRVSHIETGIDHHIFELYTLLLTVVYAAKLLQPPK